MVSERQIHAPATLALQLLHLPPIMKPLAAILLLAATFATAQTPEVQAPSDSNPPQATLTMRSNLVVVPALVRTKSGELVYTLKA